jgi:hypothetical protein
MKNDEIISLSKTEVAQRQLEAALNLYFQDGDIVPIHALTAGAGEIIRVLNKAQGGDRMLNDLIELLEGRMRKQFAAHINKVENFLKHASRDSTEIVELNPIWTEIRLYEASRTYINLVRERRSILMEAFIVWFGIVHREFFDANPELKALLDRHVDPRMKEHCDRLARRHGGRLQFLRNYVDAWNLNPASSSNRI